MFSKMVDMRRTDEEKIAADGPFAASTISGPTGPDYPYGLRIRLSEEELSKLDLDGDCSAGDMIDLRAFAKVVNVNVDDVNGKPRRSIELQIQQLAVENEEEDEEPAATPRKRTSRYG